MAASDPDTRRTDGPEHAGGEVLGADALQGRLREEIGRAERYGAGLSCLLVVFDDIDEVAHEHGAALREQMVEYVAGALLAELRRFDRVGRSSARDLLVILPGTDSPRGEIVARRALARLRTIKLEVDGRRLPLRVSVGLAAWQQDVSAERLIARARAAVELVRSENGARPNAGAGVPVPDPADPPATGSQTERTLGRLVGQ